MTRESSIMLPIMVSDDGKRCAVTCRWRRVYSHGGGAASGRPTLWYCRHFSGVLHRHKRHPSCIAFERKAAQ